MRLAIDVADIVQSTAPSSFFKRGANVAWPWSCGRGISVPAFDLSNRFYKQASSEIRQPGRQTAGCIIRLDSHAGLQQYGPGIHPFVHQHRGNAGFALSVDEAHWIGPAPRYFGKSEPCTLIQPRWGSERMADGRMRPNAATAIRSGFQPESSARKSTGLSFLWAVKAGFHRVERRPSLVTAKGTCPRPLRTIRLCDNPDDTGHPISARPPAKERQNPACP